MDKFYITTPIYYINDIPHIGHAYTTVAADIIARYYKQKLGDDKVFFLTGTDEHGAKIYEAAKKSGKEPKEFADSIVPQFESAWNKLDVKYNHFFRTTDPRHEKIVQEILTKIKDKGLIYEGIYEGPYCVGCEKFYTQDELTNEKCPLHPNITPKLQKEKNYFFKLSEFNKYLANLFETNTVNILPISKRNEILGKLNEGLRDTAISREGVSWGIPIPWDKNQTVYVWVEALLNYFTATQFLDEKQKFWPTNVHFIGKDILWFHTIIWCALLKAADIEPPKSVFAHGFFTINGTKMSKSLGNVISPNELVEKFGVDATRYLLVSQFPFGQDGDFSIDKLIESYNANLANGLGNVISRVAKLAENSNIEFSVNEIPNEIYRSEQIKALEEYAFDAVLQNIWATDISAIDQHIDKHQPWTITDKTLLKQILQEEINDIRKLALKLKPFIPNTATKIEEQFKNPLIKAESPLFPRI